MDERFASPPPTRDGGLETDHMRRNLASKLFGKPLEAVRVGRYVVVDRIGSGASGSVYRAYDPDLDRKVALKLVNVPVLDEPTRRLILREGRALARISHPNVVTVHEVGEHRDAIYLVMEFVDGGDLAGWVRTHPAPLPTLLDLLLGAGRGLAVAHREGLIHRDFKPANVLVSSSGVAKVADFGLARPVAWTGSSGALTLGSDDGDASQPSTRVAGTPVYMAPELLAGVEASRATDVFSFCVAGWEILYGRRPWPDLAWASGAAPRPSDRPVPRYLRRILERGLSRDPQARWSSMEALLEAIARHRRGVRRVAFGASAMGVLSLAGVGSLVLRADEPCPDPTPRFDETLDAPRLQRLGVAFASTGLPYAQDTWTRVAWRLERDREAWIAMAGDACRATHVRREQSPELLDLRMDCLLRHRDAVGAVATVFEAADAQVVEHANEIVDGLPSLARCEDLEALRSEIPPPPAARLAAVEAVRTTLARAQALVVAGKYIEAQAAVSEAREASTGLGYGPLDNEVRFASALATDQGGDPAGARPDYEEVVRIAIEYGQWELGARAAIHLVSALINVDNAPDRALVYAGVALGLARREGAAPSFEPLALRGRAIALTSGGRLDEAQAEIQRALELLAQRPDASLQDVAVTRAALGRLLHRQGNGVGAVREMRTAVELSEQVLGPEHPSLAPRRDGLGVVLTSLGRFDEAEREHRRALELLEGSVPPESAEFASVHQNLANALAGQGRWAESETHSQRAIELWTKNAGPRGVQVGLARGDYAAGLIEQGRHAEAERELAGTIEILSEALSPKHPHVVMFRGQRAAALRGLGRTADAEEAYRRVLLDKQEVMGVDHPSYGYTLEELGGLLVERGALDEAEPMLRQALGIFEAAMGPDVPEVAAARVSLGRIALARGRTEAAIASFEAALPIVDRPDLAAEPMAETALLLATALRRVDPRDPRAAELVARARRRCDAAEQGCASLRAEFAGFE